MSSIAIHEGNEQQVICDLLDNTYSYLEMEQKIKESNAAVYDVVILNQYKDICFFLFSSDRVTVVSPYIPICQNNTIYFSCLDEELGQCRSHVCYLRNTEKTNRILCASKILLINYSNHDKFTVPRLNLSTHTLAAYLRTRSLVRVYLIDMQFDLVDQDVVHEIESICPDVIGLSINYGFFERSIDFLDNLYESARKNDLNIHIILGNIIPAQNYKDYLERYDNIVISYAEGERAIKDYIDHVDGKKAIDDVSGIYYYDKKQNMFIRNSLKLEDMDSLPFPALDTLLEIKKRRGALSLEFSRGCSHSKCTFCPRDHKGGRWRSMSAMHMYKFSEKMYDVCKKEGMSTRFYIADEEFVGRINDGDEDGRITEYFLLLQQNEINITIDVSCRVDSVYDPAMNGDFNSRKIEMWRFCSKNGLGRVFLGVESFSDEQLVRYKKGTTCEQNIIAIKILTELGIDIRLGILLFDQMMNSVSEIRENVRVLGRDDIIQGPSNHKHCPLYMKTSYLLTTMEVLKGSAYLRACESHGLVSNENKSWGKYDVEYINPYVGIMSQYLSRWVNKNYPIVYALKTLLKSSGYDEYRTYDQILGLYKMLNYRLLQYFVEYLDDSGLTEENVVPFSNYLSHSFIEDERIFVKQIDEFFEKALYDAKEIFADKLKSLAQKTNKNCFMEKKLLQLIDEYRL